MVKNRNRARKAVIEVDINEASRGIGKRARRRRRRTRRASGVTPGDVYRTGPSNVFTSSMSRDGGVLAGYSFDRGMPQSKISQRGDVVVVSKCEIRGEINAQAAFTASVIEAGAMIPGKLAWLAGVAANYSKWRWVKLHVYYVPTTGTTTTGGVGFGFGYDMAEAQATSVSEIVGMDQGYWAASWMPMQSARVFDVGRVEKVWWPYIGGAVFDALTGTDQNIYSPGYIEEGVDASSVTAGSTLGFVWVDYIVELCDPIPAARQP